MSAPTVDQLRELRLTVAAMVTAEVVLARSTAAPSTPRPMSERSRLKRRKQIKADEAAANRASMDYSDALFRLSEELDRLRLDAARLDWLESLSESKRLGVATILWRGGHDRHGFTDGSPVIVEVAGPPSAYIPFGEGSTLREAIDAARSAGAPQESR